MLKYLNGTIVMQEVPDEISLAIVIAGCQHKCPDCHSKYTWNEDQGQPLLQNLPIILKEYAKHVSCFCLMGGDQDQHELIQAFKQAHKAGLKTCLYTGLEDMSQLNLNLVRELDYVKLGKFDKSCGPLNNPKTNQRMMKKDYSPFGDIEDWIDITYKFWPRDELI